MTQRVFVGDVQGCAEELEALLSRVRAAFGGDFELWLVGDLINRGPHNLRVLERVRRLRDEGRARVVLGNHEIGLLLKWLGLRPLSSADTLQDVLASPSAADWVGWLRSLPLVETGRVAGEPFAMVHAAVHPDWDLPMLERLGGAAARRLRDEDESGLRGLLAEGPGGAERDVLDRLTRCRSVDAGGAWSDALPATPADAWHARWRERGHEYGVVYGHWALQGLHVAPRLRGLDTGCVHHGRDHEGLLTAWLPDDDAGFALPDARFWQIPATRVYYEPRRSNSESSV